jgi:pyruvate/2-oxoglutarate dehydrogenase complex dihydrolipoamide acyltransferase (E2) component
MSSRWITAALATAIVGGVIGVVLSGGFAPQPPAQEDANTEPNTTPAATTTLAALPAAQANNLPVLPAKAATTTPSASSVSLWDATSLQEVENHGITQHLTQVDPQLLDNLSVGQQLALALPGRSSPTRSTLSETRNTAGSAVWQGSLLDGDEVESMTLVKGALETHITVATLDGSLSIIIDNATGKTVITDENQLVLRADPNDHLHYDHKEHSPLPLPPPTQG